MIARMIAEGSYFHSMMLNRVSGSSNEDLLEICFPPSDPAHGQTETDIAIESARLRFTVVPNPSPSVTQHKQTTSMSPCLPRLITSAFSSFHHIHPIQQPSITIRSLSSHREDHSPIHHDPDSTLPRSRSDGPPPPPHSHSQPAATEIATRDLRMMVSSTNHQHHGLHYHHHAAHRA